MSIFQLSAGAKRCCKQFASSSPRAATRISPRSLAPALDRPST
ncbi:MAG: hypothetical protein QNJ54_31995 [Prochloraceae cyanobacterium]|nr:hypothetical protein [Prochloraceae cyanobacterium]